MSGRIIEMRQKLRAGLEKLKPESDWSFITTQIGMFAYTGLTAEQVPPSPWSVRLSRQALRRLFCLLPAGFRPWLPIVRALRRRVLSLGCQSGER